MATLDQLSVALRNADAAGDADAARVLAAEITKMRGGSAQSATSTAADVIKSVPDAVASGLTNFAGAPGGAINWLTNKANAALGLTDVPAPPGSGPSRYADTGDYKKAVENVTGELYKPQTSVGKLAHAGVEAVSNPASYLAPGTIPAKIIGAAASGFGSEGAGQAAQTYAPELEPYARIIGALGGAVAPSAAAHAFTPAPATPARQRLVDILNNEGVTSTTAGQRTGSNSLRYLESALGDAPLAGGKTSAITRQGQEQFTEAATRRAGYAGDAGPEALTANHDRLTGQFRDLSARNNMTPDNRFITDVVDAVRNYRRVPDSQQRAMVQGYVDDIIPHVNAGSMPGTMYQEMRSRLSRQSNSLRDSDPTLSEALRDLRNALDNAMGRSISPADRELWNETRRQYGAQKVIEKSASKAGEATAEGLIPPANLRNTVAAENRGAYARGQGDFSELARAGAGVMAPMPQSGTGPRSMIYHLSNLMSAGVAPAVAGRVLMSSPVQGYLGNQMLTGVMPHVAPRPRTAVIDALMAAQQQQSGGQ